MQRREFLKLGATAAPALALRRSCAFRQEPGDGSVPIIDAHIHLFDPTRPGGVPWPTPDDSVLYRPALPERFAAVTKGLGVVGAIAIEASPLPGDNDWLLKVAADHPLIVGAVGDLIPGSSDYLRDLERLHRNPLFLGLRYGNLWNRDLAVDLEKPGFIDGVKALAEAGLVFESANPDRSLVKAILKVADLVPDVKIVIDHLPNAKLPEGKTEIEAYWKTLRRLAQNPRVFVKLSEIPVAENGKLETSASFYRPRLDAIWSSFGEDHILYGSDWPNSDHVASYVETLRIVRDYVTPKGRAVCEKFFWKNSIAAYKWRPRKPDQPRL